MYFVIIFINLIISIKSLLLYFSFLSDKFKINKIFKIIFALISTFFSVVLISYVCLTSHLLFGIFNGVISTILISLLYGIITSITYYHDKGLYYIYIFVGAIEGFSFGLCTSVCVNILNNIMLLNGVNPIVQTFFELIVCLITVFIINIIIISVQIHLAHNFDKYVPLGFM
jgi:hypothetical protein